jgi:tetratricopeptide (TPR) repeat protein
MGDLKVKRSAGMVFLLAVMVFCLYFNTLDNEATNWDDPALFSRTVLHEMTWDNVRRVFSLESFSTYQPLRDLSYMIDFGLWGPSEKRVVFGMHVQSMVLYFVMCLSCWLFLLQLFRVFTGDPDRAFIWASLSALIFTAHPVHVESVAWLYARKEQLLGIFVFLCMRSFIRARVMSWGHYVSSAVFLVLAILSKPTALMLPAALIVMDFAVQARRRDPGFLRTRAFLYVPMLLVVVPMGIRLVTMMYEAGGVKLYHGGSFGTNLLAVSQILASYISLIGFTVNYAADYPIRLFTDPLAWQPWAYVGLNAALVLSALVAWVLRRHVYAFFVFWIYVFLLPVAHFFPIAQIMADRYALLSSLSWCVLLGFLLMKLWTWRFRPGRFSPDFPRAIAVALVSLVICFYGYMTWYQNNIWQNSQTLWEDTLAKYPRSSPANVNLAAIYLMQMRFSDVQELCLAAIRSKPYDYLAISNLALAQLMMDQYDNAINNYLQALKLKPDLEKARLGLAQAYWFSGRYEKAYILSMDLLSRGVIREGENYVAYLYRAGYAAWKTGRKEEPGPFSTGP